jgi:hypothetical protein
MPLRKTAHAQERRARTVDADAFRAFLVYLECNSRGPTIRRSSPPSLQAGSGLAQTLPRGLKSLSLGLPPRRAIAP